MSHEEADDGTIELGGAIEPYGVNGLPEPSDRRTMEVYDPFAATQRYWANWTLQTREDKRRVLRCFSETSLGKADLINQTVEMTHVLVHPITIVDEATGEITPCHRAVLVLKDGRLASFVSAGIMKSLSLICMMEGTGPWPEGLKVRLRQIPLKKSRQTLALDLVETEAQPTEATSGKKRRG